MKDLFKNIIIGAFVLLILSNALLLRNNRVLNSNLDTSRNNEKSLLEIVQGQKNDIIAYRTDLSTLKHVNDSIIQRLVRTVDELGIKEKQIQELLGTQTIYTIRDTIIIKEPIFQSVDSVLNFGFIDLDTILTNEWRTLHLGLRYPSTITTDISVKSKKDVVIYSVRETINKPSKVFFIRWFQKKHILTRVNIHENNPYITSDENVYIKISE